MSSPIPNSRLRRVASRLFPSGKDTSDRRWLVVSAIALALLLLHHHHAHSQVVSSNPGEYTILATGNGIINNTVKSETKAERNTALMQNAMAGEFTKMKRWEKEYNSYLKTASGYASALKAAVYRGFNSRLLSR